MTRQQDHVVFTDLQCILRYLQHQAGGKSAPLEPDETKRRRQLVVRSDEETETC
jgi:hypothetical protein